MKESKTAIKEYIGSLLGAIIIALAIRTTVVYPFTIPTGSMEGSLLVGDFILANKFVYGIRTPDWIGIPYTDIGFSVPCIRTPGPRKPESGDIVIFRYPYDKKDHWVKRCIAVSGDTVEIINKAVYVNGKRFADAENVQFIDNGIMPRDIHQPDIFPSDAGNTHNYGPIRVPAPGDTFQFSAGNKSLWHQRFQLMIYENAEIILTWRNQSVRLTLENQPQWRTAIARYPMDSFMVDRAPLGKTVYTVHDEHYFLMGDNRDNSLDSRFWGCLPERYIVGEPIVIWWSWNKEMPLYRLFEKVRWNRLFSLVR